VAVERWEPSEAPGPIDEDQSAGYVVGVRASTTARSIEVHVRVDKVHDGRQLARVRLGSLGGPR
jgi:hypothetical protein